MNNIKKTNKIIISALFLALAYILPFITGQIQQIGIMLCPMHFPVLICGFVCGWQWGLLIGFVAPLLRSAAAGMPPMFPAAISMAFELAVYGAVSGLMYRWLPKNLCSIYISLITAMLSGRIIWGAVRFTLAGFNAAKFGFSAFLAGAVTSAIPGIIIQLALIPPIVAVLSRYFEKDKS